MSLKYQYHQDKTIPKSPSYIFIVGTNLRGIHGAGAAECAWRYHDAKRGRFDGFLSDKKQSYGIPTKGEWLEVLPLDTIQSYVNKFVSVTFEYPDAKFFVSRVGCGLAGYKDSDIAPMFEECNTNCSFAEQWKPFLG